MRCVIYSDLRCLSRGSCNNTWWAFLYYFLLAFNPYTSPPSLYFWLKRSINVCASWGLFSVELRGMALMPLFSMSFSLPFPSHLVKSFRVSRMYLHLHYVDVEKRKQSWLWAFLMAKCLSRSETVQWEASCSRLFSPLLSWNTKS